MAERKGVRAVTVLALRRGRFDLPENVVVRAFGAQNRVVTLLKFYREVLRSVMVERCDCFLVYQGGPYPALLAPFRYLMGRPIYQWKAHPHIDALVRLYAGFCTNKVFTSTPGAFPLKMPKVRVVGQGVDVAKFRPEAVEKTGDLVSVGRLSPIKGLDRMIEALAECNSRFGTSYRLDIHGPLPQRDREYVEHLRDLIRRLQLSHLVSLHPSVSHDSVPGILNRARVYLNFSRTALDRAVVEAMACGLPVISTNPCVKEILPPALQELLFVGWDDADGQAERIHRALSWDEASLAETSRAMREIVARDHSFEALIGKLLKEMGVC